MADNQRQHHVPVAYLQFFDHTGVHRGRESQLYASEAERSFLVGVTNVAVESYLYSRSNPTAAERFFHETEQHYPSVIQRLHQGDLRPPATSLIAMQLMILHLRNARYDFENFDERIDAVAHSTERFLYEVLLRGAEPPTMGEMANAIEGTWALQLIRATDNRFITSDNASLLFTVGEGGLDDIVAMMLPLRPDTLAIIRRRDKTEAKADYATEADVGRFNQLQVIASDRFVFSAEPFTHSDREKIRSLSVNYSYPNGVLARGWWRPNAFCNYGPGFSFIEL